MAQISTSLEAARSRIANLLSHSGGLRRLLSLARWTLMSFALEKGATLVIVFLVARTLGAEDYGRLSLAQGLVNTMQIFVVLGAGAVLGRYIPSLRQQGFVRAVEVINLCAVLVLGSASLFLLLASTIGRQAVAQVLHVEQGSPFVGWVIAWVLVVAAVNLLMTVMLSFERGREMGLVSLVGAVVAISVVPTLAAGFGLAGAILGLMVVETLKLAMLVWLYRRLLAIHGAPMLTRPRRSDLRLLLHFGVPVFLTSALWAPTMWLSQLIVGLRSPGGLSDVGVFGFSNSLLGAVILISSLTNQAALPILASLRGEGKLGELRRVSSIIALAQVAVAFCIAVPIAVLAPWIMSLVGPVYLEHWPVLLIMVATGVVLAAQTAFSNYLLVTDRQLFILASMAPWGATLLLAAWFGANHGAYALAYGLLAASVFRTVMFCARFTVKDDAFTSDESR